MKTHDHTSVLSRPRGCQTRNVGGDARSSEKFGKTVGESDNEAGAPK